MTDKKILAVGDLHGVSTWKNIDFSEYDKVVFLGDYVDSFDLTDKQIYDNLKELIEAKKKNPKIVPLWGNHDVHYLSNPPFQCTGYRPSMFAVLNQLFEENKGLFELAYQKDNYLFTHAGVSQGWHDEYFKAYNKKSEMTMAEKLNKAFKDRHSSIYQIGRTRGGWAEFGGPLWADMSELTWLPLKGYKQIVGHTRTKEIIETKFAVFIDVIEENPGKDIKELTYEIKL